jgi:hypothetical protein
VAFLAIDYNRLVHYAAGTKRVFVLGLLAKQCKLRFGYIFFVIV